MEIGNAILFWVIGGFVLFVANFTIFRFSLLRKAVYIISSVVLIASGFELASLMEEHAIHIGGSVLSWNNSNIDTLVSTSVIMLLLAILMTFGDSLLDFEDTIEYDVGVFSLFGIYFLNVSEEVVPTSEFFTYYAIATVAALIIYYVGFIWFEWFSIFGIIGIITLVYTLVLKPVMLKFSN